MANKSIIRIKVERLQVLPNGTELSEYDITINSKRLPLDEAKETAIDLIKVLPDLINKDSDSDPE